MPKTFFITGTDTGVGKTTVTCALLAKARGQGLSTMALKPIAAGCEQTPEGLRNDDALALMAHMTEPLSYAEVNPVALPEPLSPHLAAALAGKRLTSQQIAGYTRGGLSRRVDLALVEGAGGWRVPISDREFFSEIPKLMRLPVILVVGLRLGCINHALLTAEAVIKDGLRIAGWVGNVVDPGMQALDGNIDTLQRMLPFPCLGIVPWSPQASAETRAEALDLAPLLAS
jgi:dethiobiotin synthetase